MPSRGSKSGSEDFVDPLINNDHTTPGDTAAAPERKPKRRGFYLTPRQAFGGLALVLALLLIGLILYLLSALQPRGFVAKGGETLDGIKPLLAITGPGKGDKPKFDRPMGVAFGKEGRIYVADTGNNRVVVFDRNGKYLKQFGEFGVAKPLPGIPSTWKPGRLNFPTGVATDEGGNVYVADFHNDQVQVFTSEGKFVRAFPDRAKPTGRGSSGQDGQGIAVTAVAVRGDYVYATDTYQVFVFRKTGELVRQFGMPGLGPSGLDHPNGIDVAEDGTIYVSDSNHNRVSAFSADGKPLWQLGRPAQATTATPDPNAERAENGVFGLPRGLTVLDNDELIVVDTFDFRLVRLSTDGKELARYGDRGVAPAQMNFPNAVDAQGDRLVVADKENGRAIVVRLIGR